ncbi:MAG: site-2 protease family protein [Bacillota bacterium]
MHEFIRQSVLVLPGLLLGFALHECMHAWTARLLGDDTGERLGRLTLDPTAHFDVIGFATAMFFGFGWAKPVPVNPLKLKHPTRDMALIAASGPLANMALVAVFATVAIFGLGGPGVVQVAQYGAIVNAGLAVFNLLPLPPLDGYRVIIGIVGSRPLAIERLEPFGPLLLVVLIISGLGDVVISPAKGWLLDTLAGVAQTVTGLLR